MRRIFLVLLAVALLSSVMGAEAFAARSGGTLNFMAPYGGDLFGLDPHKSTRVQDFLVGINIHRCLYMWDPQQNKCVLDLADKVDISDDGLVYTYHLRENIKFHNGRPMTVDDIIWSYNRIASMQPASPSARYHPENQGRQGRGRWESRFHRRVEEDRRFQPRNDPGRSRGHRIFALRELGTAILPKEEVEKLGDAFSTNPVGCGPFKFVKWTKGSEVVLEKFPEFYLEGRPYLDKVIYKIMGEAAARDLAFKAKELDATIVGAVNYPEYKADPVISKNMIEVAELFTRQVGFNPDFEPFSKKEVRQAINYAVNAELIIEKLLKGKAFPCRGYLPTTSPVFNENGKKYEYNPEKAKELMKQAGYEDGFTVEQCIGTANKSWGTGIYEAMIPFLKKINITLVVQQMEGAAMAERIRQGDFQTYIWSLGTGPDPLATLERWKSENQQSAGNYVKYNNPNTTSCSIWQRRKEILKNRRNCSKTPKPFLWKMRPYGSSTTTRPSWRTIPGSTAWLRSQSK